MITWCVSSELIHTRTSDRVVPLVAVNALNSFNIVNFFRDRFHYIAFEFVFTHSTGLIFLPIRAANIAILIALSPYFFLAND